jgi:hypothetical protein
MTQENYNNTFQVDLQYCVLFNYLNDPENIEVIVDSIDIGYDLFQNAINCKIQVTDPAAFLENFPIIGDETLVLGFKTPLLEINPTITKFDKLLTFVFRIYRIEDRKQTANRASLYTLYGISSEAINNMRYSVNRTYYDWRGENVVQDIYDNYLKPSPIEYDLIKQVDETASGKKLKRLPSGENICLNFSNFRPLDAINRVCFETQDIDNTLVTQKIKYNSNASSNTQFQQPPKKEYTVDITERTKSTKSSNFIFYENDDGWNFVTIDHLLYRDRTLIDGGGLVQDFYFLDSRVDPSTSKSIFGKNIRQDQRILELNFIRQMDNAENMDRGLYSSTLVSLDPLTKRIEFDPFIYDRDYKDIAHLETDLDGPQRVGIFSETSLYTESKVNNHKTKCDEFQHKNYVITNLGPEYDETDGVFKNARARDHQLRNPKKFHEFLKYDYASKVQFNNIIISFTIPGNSDIQIGHMVNLNILSNNIDDFEQKQLYNRLFGNENFGGFFLVTKVNHTILFANKSYVTEIECVKDTYATTKFRDTDKVTARRREVQTQVDTFG